MRNAIALIVMVTLGLLTTACGSSPERPDAPQYNSFIGGSEFVVGENRFPFVLVSQDLNVLEGATIHVEFYSLEGGGQELKLRAPAHYREVRGVTPHTHEDGELHEHLDLRVAYVVDQARFDTSGIWIARFDVTTADGKRPTSGELAFQVLEAPVALGVGQRVPETRNLTVHDVDSIEEIDSRVPPDDMHDMSVAQALEDGKPFVVVWSTPMYCISVMCGPVTDQVIALQPRYRDRVNFIHIEPWDLKTARNEGRLVPTPEFVEWSLPSEPWVYVVGEDGRVVARFEGLVTSGEIEGAIQKVLAVGSGN